MESRDSKNSNSNLRLLALVVFFALILSIAIYSAFNADTIGQLNQIFSNWITQAGAFGWLLIIVLMILHSFVPFPSTFIALAAGMTYDFFTASIIVWFGAMLGAILAFAIAGWLGEPFVSKILGPKAHQKLEKWKANQGVPTLLISRLIPVISFNLINYASGLVGVPFWTFLWTTAIGIIPMTILAILVGAGMGNLPPEWVIGLTTLGLLLVFGVHLWFRMHQNRD